MCSWSKINLCIECKLLEHVPCIYSVDYLPGMHTRDFVHHGVMKLLMRVVTSIFSSSIFSSSTRGTPRAVVSTSSGVFHCSISSPEPIPNHDHPYMENTTQYPEFEHATSVPVVCKQKAYPYDADARRVPAGSKAIWEGGLSWSPPAQG